MIQAAIFDMDGLLIDSEPLWRMAEKEALGRVGFRLTDEMCEEAVGLRVHEVVHHWYRHESWPDADLPALEREIVGRMNHLIRENGRIMEGANEVVDFFWKSGIPIALASSSHRVLMDAFLTTSGLASKFAVVHSAEQEEYGKPHPAVFLSAARLLGVPPQDCLVFEDSPNGVIAARAARMKVVAVPEKNNRSEYATAHLVLRSLAEWSAGHWERLR